MGTYVANNSISHLIKIKRRDVPDQTRSEPKGLKILESIFEKFRNNISDA